MDGNDTKAELLQPGTNKYSLESLRENCRKVFDVSDSTFAGAVSGIDPGKQYSVEEIQKYLDNWKKRRSK